MGVRLRSVQGYAIAIIVGLIATGCTAGTQPSTGGTQPPTGTPQPDNSVQQPNNSTQQPNNSTQQYVCDGRMNNGWAYSAENVNRRFVQIRWERAGQPPQTSTLTFSDTNAQGEPIYRGTFQAATAVTLVDLSRGNVQPGSEVSVGVEEWGWARGRCRR